MSDMYLTRAGLLRVQQELKALQDEIRECNRKIGHTVSLDNDLRENPEFMALRTKAEYELPARITALSNILNNHALVETTEHILSNECEFIGVGNAVTLEDDDGNARLIHILGFGESNPEHSIVSFDTPLAKALLDREIGDEISLPYQGKSVNYKVVNITRTPYLK
ncbi:GreA/GreB family elongation factor [Atlantibacter subterraneus]|jgi:transcription elongation GreA/GreB family factor|uniref:GreA/GreB family elongation factor n=1 Tax=Atlantibacter subterraneus TaxID=255519 RepID=UPI002899ECE3|nr:GreA/GreB family elongation factor [Atlantibacter subterranea]